MKEKFYNNFESLSKSNILKLDKTKNNSYLKMIVVKPTNKYFAQQCEEISFQNADADPGFARNFNQFQHCDYLLVALIKNKTVGFTIATEIYPKTFYLSGIAVSKDYARQGIGTKMIEYVSQHSVNIEYLQSHVLKTNDISNYFHLKLGFIQSNEANMPLHFVYKKQITEKKDKKPLSFTPEEQLNEIINNDSENE